MKSEFLEIEQALPKYDLHLSTHKIHDLLNEIEKAQQYFPVGEQQALIIKLLCDWQTNKGEKIITATSEACRLEGGICVTTFGVLSVDWPGLFDACSGVIHAMGWNIYFIKGISLVVNKEKLGIILIGIKTDKKVSHKRLIGQTQTILSRIHRAAVGTSAKTYLISEEIQKLEIYSRVIALIETMYKGEDLHEIIGMNGEAVKYFAARSRDYIENRKIEDIAKQIILNYTLMKAVHQGSNIQLDISNFTTQTEGIFTGVTVAGPTHMLHLEDCLKTIELVIPNFQLKHNREFSTEKGISLYRIEFIDSTNHPLSELEQKRLKKAFSTMVLNKQRDRAQWIESIGGFEQYARAIIPLLVRETQSTDKTQVYISVGHSTDLFIDFKVIIVIPKTKDARKKLMTKTVNHLETVSGIHILRVKPPKTFGSTEVFILDLRANLSDIENIETIYLTIKETIHMSLGEFRDFDEGMRTIDTTKLKSVRHRMKGIHKSLIRELYYSIEDFYRVGASIYEIIAHIRIAIDMINAIEKKNQTLLILNRSVETETIKGNHFPSANLICISYPHELALLQKILEIFEPYEVTLSRLERSGRDILICRIMKDDAALQDDERKELVKQIRKLVKDKKTKKQ
ncbi:hypothetical protein JW824_15070 [bacterium]|nr:hypothetical protein [bacterium]